MIPIRFLFRSRWAALAWAAGICVSAANFADDRMVEGVDATRSADNHAAQSSALHAEDAE